MIVTATDVVGADDLLARLDALSDLSREARSRVAVMLRDPGLGSRELLRLGERLRERTRALGASLWVNDRLDLAKALGADAVHLGRRSVAIADAKAFLGDAMRISVACHAPGEVAEAAAAGASAALLSPVFASPGKGPAIGTEALAAARAALAAAGGSLALYALGGVDAGRAAACLAAGADGVATVRAEPRSTLTALLAT